MKHLKCITAIAVLLAVVSLGSTLALSIFAQSKGQEILSKISRKIPGLELKAVSADNGLFTKTGRLYLHYVPDPKEHGGIMAAFDYKVNLGFLGVSGSFERVSGFGNVDEMMRPFLGSLPRIHGRFSASLFEMGASADLQSDAFSLPVNDGRCNIKPATVKMALNAALDVNARFNLSGLDCTADRNYRGRKAYNLDLKNLYAELVPELSKNSLKKIQLDVGAQTFAAEASTLYLIGFGPDDEVKDPSLREGFSLDEPKLIFNVDEPDVSGLQALGIKISGNYAFGMPFIRNDTMIPMHSFKDLDLDAKISSVDLKGMIKTLKKGELTDLKRLISSPAVLDLKRLFFKKGGETFESSGSSSLVLGYNGKLQDLSADFSVKAGKKMVIDFCQNGYGEMLDGLVKNGSITLSGDEYSTRLQLQNEDLKLNGVSFQSGDESEDGFENTLPEGSGE